MKICKKVLFIVAITLSLVTCAPEKKHFTIATGSKGAIFYPVAKALCSVIKDLKKKFSCEAVSTEGSMFNLNAVQANTHDLGLSQFNLQYNAYQGAAPFDKKFKNIRTVAPLHQEVFILAVAKGVEIKKFEDILGKRINIGNPGSGSRIITEQLFKQKSWTLDDIIVEEAKSGDLPQLFCNGGLDAAIYSTGHPNKIYHQMITECGVKLIDLWDEDVEKFVQDNWQFDKASITANTYPSQKEFKKGFGIRVVLSANKKVPEKWIKEIVETLIEHQHLLRKKAEIYRSINANIYPLNYVAPYHEGAINYYKKPD